jgi:ABC-type uncharacterized transport system involved in gliding motility auxiliary subunit
MLDQSAYGIASEACGADNLLKLGRQQAAATFKIQRDVLDAFEQTSRAWLARVQSEVELWSQLAARLAATHSVPEALGAYQESVTQRMQMAAEDGKRLSSDCQEMMGKLTKALSRGWPSGST